MTEENKKILAFIIAYTVINYISPGVAIWCLLLYLISIFGSIGESENVPKNKLYTCLAIIGLLAYSVHRQNVSDLHRDISDCSSSYYNNEGYIYRSDLEKCLRQSFEKSKSDDYTPEYR